MFIVSDVTLSYFRYSDLNYYLAIHEVDKAVLPLKVEREIDPTTSMPFILAVSCRDLQLELKTIVLALADGLISISPPYIEEVSLMTAAITIMTVAFKDVYPNYDMFNGKSKDEATSLV